MSGYLGIDWGTHSSKWAFQRRELNTLVGSIWDSAVCPAGPNLEMFTMERRHQDASREVALKRKLIRPPINPSGKGPPEIRRHSWRIGRILDLVFVDGC